MPNPRRNSCSTSAGAAALSIRRIGPHERTEGPSLWGHDRLWLTEQGREEARALRIRAAQSGSREPVNVLDGNYARAADVCPWWNANVQARKIG